MTADELIDEILRREGGYVDHPADRGGPTNYGITQATLSDWRGSLVSKQDVRDLTEAEARAIYQRNYITRPGFHRINNPHVQGLAVDMAVNHGPTAAVKMIQRAVGTKDDGILGPQTLAAVNMVDPVRVYRRMVGQRARFFGRIISKDPKLAKARQAGFALQAEFASGWLNRLAEFVEEGP